MLIQTPETALENELMNSRAPDDADSKWPRIYADLFPEQQLAIDDPSNRKCFEKGRRAGGSWLSAAWLLENYHEWGGHSSFFVALTKDHAKRIIWGTLEKLNAKYELGGVSNGLDYTWKFPIPGRPGLFYTIMLKGAKDRSQVEALRGTEGGLRRVVIDEAGSFFSYDRQFRYMIREVIAPQFMDTFHLGGGQLVLSGSPGIDPAGFYYEKCTGQTHDGKPAIQWSVHHWTCLHNPTLDARAYLLEELSDNRADYIVDDTEPAVIVEWLVELKDVPLGDERWAPVQAKLTPGFRREYLADWCKDTDALVYVARPRNILPEGHYLDESVPWRVVIGCDIGWNDGNGFAVAAKSLRSRDIVLCEAYYLDELDDEQIAAELRRLRTVYRSGEIYVDDVGAGDRLVANMEHFGVIVQAAPRGRKKPRIEYVRTVLQSGALLIRPDRCAALLQEWEGLPWSEDRQTHREGFHDDVSDAALAAINALSQRFSPAKPGRPKRGTPEYDAWIAKRERELAGNSRSGKRRRKRSTRLLTEPGDLIELFPPRRIAA